MLKEALHGLVERIKIKKRKNGKNGKSGKK